MVKTNSGEHWGLLKKNIKDSRECLTYLNTEIFVNRRPTSFTALELAEQIKKDRERFRENAGLSEEEFKLMEAKVSATLTVNQVLEDLKALHAAGGLTAEEFKSMTADVLKDESLVKTSPKNK